MRAKGVNQQEICDYINSQGYQKFITKRGGHTTFTMVDNILRPSLSIVKDERALQTITDQIGEVSQIVQQQEQLIEKYQRSIERSTLPAIDKDEFKATLKEMAEKLRAADVVQKDIIVSNLFLKLHFDQQKMTRCILKEPFASLLEFSEFQNGGAGWD